MKGRTYRYMEQEAQYPFGYGLTYSDVTVDSVKVKKAEICKQAAGEEGLDPAITPGLASDGDVYRAEVEVTVTNRGSVSTDEVVQIYLENKGSANAPVHAILAGFKRIRLKAGETKSISLPMRDPSFTVVDNEGKRIHDGRSFVIHAGTSQPDAKSIALTGHTPATVEIDF